MRSRVKAGLRSRSNQRAWEKMQSNTRISVYSSKSTKSKESTEGSSSLSKTERLEQMLRLLITAAVFLYLFLLILKTQIATTIAIGVTLFFFIPAAKKQQKQQKYQEKRFHEMSVYMDTILYAFAKEGKIDAALSDVYMALEEGELKSVVREALSHMRLTFDDTDVMSNSLAMIEKEYPARRLQNIHAFMVHVESYGGDIVRPVELLLTDKEMWELRTKSAIQVRAKMFRDVVLSVLMSLLICGIVQHIPVMNVDISQNPIAQVGTFLVFLLDEFILLRGLHLVAQDWIAYDEANEDVYFERKVQEYQRPNKKKEKRFSMISGAIAAAIAAQCFRMGKEWMGAVALLGMTFLLYQHRIGHQIARKQLVKEVQRAFPNWLMDLVLLLQSENVQVALQKSRSHVPGVMKAELKSLVERLEIDPEDALPYHQFLQQYGIPEIQSAMSMLYSIAAGHGGNSSKQIGDLIKRNQKMLAQAEEQKTMDLSAGLYILFLAPVVTASFKMLVDMSVFMISFLGSAMR